MNDRAYTFGLYDYPDEEREACNRYEDRLYGEEVAAGGGYELGRTFWTGAFRLHLVEG